MTGEDMGCSPMVPPQDLRTSVTSALEIRWQIWACWREEVSEAGGTSDTRNRMR
jgi:hypothetical protein